ncbi:hypothetical protein GGF32_009553 [Allomyces javanicus]|nr:hypothetical protein GGF32_009553 [Allomyces javanicus]
MDLLWEIIAVRSPEVAHIMHLQIKHESKRDIDVVLPSDTLKQLPKSDKIHFDFTHQTYHYSTFAPPVLRDVVMDRPLRLRFKGSSIADVQQAGCKKAASWAPSPILSRNVADGSIAKRKSGDTGFFAPQDYSEFAFDLPSIDDYDPYPAGPDLATPTGFYDGEYMESNILFSSPNRVKPSGLDRLPGFVKPVAPLKTMRQARLNHPDDFYGLPDHATALGILRDWLSRDGESYDQAKQE